MTKYEIQRLTGAQIPFLAMDLAHPPKELSLVGQLPRGPSIAVVGTRRPTPEALEFTGELVAQLAASGLSIWSGGAEGIDAAAHLAALKHGAKTVVVAPAGWAKPYPEGHRELFQNIVDAGGGYLSHCAETQSALRHHFFARNTLLVALTQGVLVVQAGVRSGARNAAKTARSLGRPLFIVPSCPWVHQGLGCNLEMSLGARPIGSAKDVLRHLPLAWYGLDRPDAAPHGPVTPRSRGAASVGVAGVTQSKPEAGAVAPLEQELATLLKEIAQGATSVDELCLRTGLKAAVVQSDVLRLTLQGRIHVGRSGNIEIVND